MLKRTLLLVSLLLAALSPAAASPELSKVRPTGACVAPPPVITPTPAQVCPNTAGNTASGGAGYSLYAWSITNGTITNGPNSQTITYTSGASGTVDLLLFITDAGGCVGSKNISVPIVTSSTPTANNGGPYCEGATISLFTPTVASATYDWTGPNGFLSSLQNPTRANATLADAG